MSAHVSESGTPKLLTATGTITAKNCKLLGFYVNNTSTGTLVIKSGALGTTNGTAISGTITPAIGFHRFPADCPGGCHATIANTLDVTFFVAEY